MSRLSILRPGRNAPGHVVTKAGSCQNLRLTDAAELQILRLTTPNLHPNDEDLSLGTPVKKALGAPFAQDDSLCGWGGFAQDDSLVVWKRLTRAQVPRGLDFGDLGAMISPR